MNNFLELILAHLKSVVINSFRMISVSCIVNLKSLTNAKQSTAHIFLLVSNIFDRCFTVHIAAE